MNTAHPDTNVRLPSLAPARAPQPVTRVPARLEPFGRVGWGVFEFSNAREAATWVAQNPSAKMPCWQRWDMIDGQLMLTRW